MQGTVEPDHVEIDRADGRVISYRVGNKKIATVFDRVLGAVADKELPVRFHAARCLSDEMINALWQALTQIERHFGHPVDIEWVIEPNWRPGIPVSIVQVRPITTLGTMLLLPQLRNGMRWATPRNTVWALSRKAIAYALETAIVAHFGIHYHRNAQIAFEAYLGMRIVSVAIDVHQSFVRTIVSLAVAILASDKTRERTCRLSVVCCLPPF